MDKTDNLSAAALYPAAAVRPSAVRTAAGPMPPSSAHKIGRTLLPPPFAANASDAGIKQVYF